jgi:hypothetical protein
MLTNNRRHFLKIFTVMGPGCKEVSRVHRDGTDLVTGVCEDGRIGTVRGIRNVASNIAGTASGEKGIAPLGPFSGYQPLIGEIISFFQTGKPPVQRNKLWKYLPLLTQPTKIKARAENLFLCNLERFRQILNTKLTPCQPKYITFAVYPKTNRLSQKASCIKTLISLQ